MILTLSIVVTTALFLIAAGLTYQKIAELRDEHRFKPPGDLISIDGGCALHFWKQGTGEPTVILESGIAASSLSWSHVQPFVAKFTQVVSYDRAGLGWSELCNGPCNLQQMTGQLSELLARAQIEPPFVLVGHSFGGLIIRAFAHAHPEQVASLVFVDPVSIHMWANCSQADKRRLKLGSQLSRRGAWLARFGVVRLALAAAAARNRRATRLITRVTAGKATPFLTRLMGEVQKLPSEVLPAVQAQWSRSKAFKAMAEHLEALPICAQAATALSVPAEISTLVLSAETATEAELEERNEWVRNSKQGRHVRVNQAGHWLNLERPDVVIQAIKEMVDSIRDPDLV